MMSEGQTVETVALDAAWISKTNANAAWWAEEMTGKPVLIDNDPDKECGIVTEAWISEGGDVMVEVKINPSYKHIFETDLSDLSFGYSHV